MRPDGEITMDYLNFGQAADFGTKSCLGGTMVAVYITKWSFRWFVGFVRKTWRRRVELHHLWGTCPLPSLWLTPP